MMRKRNRKPTLKVKENWEAQEEFRKYFCVTNSKLVLHWEFGIDVFGTHVMFAFVVGK